MPALNDAFYSRNGAINRIHLRGYRGSKSFSSVLLRTVPLPWTRGRELQEGGVEKKTAQRGPAL